MYINRRSKRFVAASLTLIAVLFAGFHMTTQASGLMALQAELQCETGKVQYSFSGQANTTYRIVILDWSGMPVGQSEMVNSAGSSNSGWILPTRHFDPGMMTAILAQVDKQSDPVMYTNFAAKCAATGTGTDNSTGSNNTSTGLTKIQVNPNLTIYVDWNGTQLGIVTIDHGKVYVSGTLSDDARAALLAVKVHLDAAIVTTDLNVVVGSDGIKATAKVGNNNINVNAGSNGVQATVAAPVVGAGVNVNAGSNGVQATVAAPVVGAGVNVNAGSNGVQATVAAPVAGAGVNVNAGSNGVQVTVKAPVVGSINVNIGGNKTTNH